MKKSLAIVAAATLFSLAPAAAFAECFFGHTAKNMTEMPVEQTAISTFDGDLSQPTVDETVPVSVTECAEGEDCAETNAE